MGTVGGLSSTCYQGSCQQWGLDKLIDGVDAGINSLAVTADEAMPWMQVDLGSTQAVTDIRIAASSDPTFSYTLANNLKVYLSSSPNATAGGVQCGALNFTAAGEVRSVSCPSGATGRYIVVVREGLASPDKLALQEVSALIAGEPAVLCGSSHCHAIP